VNADDLQFRARRKAYRLPHNLFRLLASIIVRINPSRNAKRNARTEIRLIASITLNRLSPEPDDVPDGARHLREPGDYSSTSLLETIIGFRQFVNNNHDIRAVFYMVRRYRQAARHADATSALNRQRCERPSPPNPL